MSEELKKYLIDTITQIQENANRVCKPYYDRLALFEEVQVQPMQIEIVGLSPEELKQWLGASSSTTMPVLPPPPSKTEKLEAFAHKVYLYWLTTDDLDDFHEEGRKLLESVGTFDVHDNFELTLE